ncbi:beta-ketoacyl synthase N-terminal-like domain-containing protein [Sorangium sp. So ce260]|uniref:beta-ketoacyl synthase N-terminal-like domain-containing protein n=1 Tax=Sorangium sp. So ce260 TaxID=3133291 RepID=UPI003F5D5B1A
MNETHEFAITGIGLLSTCGVGLDAFWSGLRGGEARFEEMESPGHACDARRSARIPDWDPSRFDESRAFRILPRCTQMAVIASQLGWTDAKLATPPTAPERVGIYVGTTYGILDDLARFEGDLDRQGLQAARPSAYQELTLGALAGHMSIQHGAHGPVIPLSNGWLSGEAALRLAVIALASDEIDVALVGAVESLGPSMHREACELGWLARQGGDPPDGEGMRLGEGAVVLCLERHAAARRRGVQPYCLVRGFGEAHAADRAPHDAAIERAMTEALRAMPRDAAVDLLVSLECGHPPVDAAEASSIQRVFDGRARDLTVLSFARRLGHAGSCTAMLGLAAGALALGGGSPPLPRGGAVGGASISDARSGAPPPAPRPRTALVNAFSQDRSYASILLNSARAD